MYTYNRKNFFAEHLVGFRPFFAGWGMTYLSGVVSPLTRAAHAAASNGWRPQTTAKPANSYPFVTFLPVRHVFRPQAGDPGDKTEMSPQRLPDSFPLFFQPLTSIPLATK